MHALKQLLILHADHEQNCSTSTVRLVGSSEANLFASIAAGHQRAVGPAARRREPGRHRDARATSATTAATSTSTSRMAKDPDDPFRLSGFGHRVYKNYDPRARILKEHRRPGARRARPRATSCSTSRSQLEEVALTDEYFIERKLYPNVDFYSGLIYRAMGFPTDMFPVLFAIGRLPGWIAHWKEMIESPKTKIGRPRQIYTGPTERTYVPIDERG